MSGVPASSWSSFLPSRFTRYSPGSRSDTMTKCMSLVNRASRLPGYLATAGTIQISVANPNSSAANPTPGSHNPSELLPGSSTATSGSRRLATIKLDASLHGSRSGDVSAFRTPRASLWGLRWRISRKRMYDRWGWSKPSAGSNSSQGRTAMPALEAVGAQWCSGCQQFRSRRLALGRLQGRTRRGVKSTRSRAPRFQMRGSGGRFPVAAPPVDHLGTMFKVAPSSV